jgi:hypothetical protein
MISSRTFVRSSIRATAAWTDFVVNLLAALVAYTYQEKKPSLNLYPDDLAALPATIF